MNTDLKGIALNTPITRLLRIRTPVICPPMAGASGGTLAAEVTAAGGFGFLAAGYVDVEIFRKELELAHSILVAKTHTRSTSLHVGAGFLGWRLNEPDGSAAKLLNTALEAKVSAVWFSFGADLGRWVKFVRHFDESRLDSPSHSTIIFILVNSVEEAKLAIEEWKADVIVAQGIEAGGHGSSTAPPLFTLVPEILSTFPDCPPLLAAGGLSTGAHVASLLALGASGAALGTRFLLTPESTYTATQKKALLEARSTVRTTAFDIARGTIGWPEGIDGRGLKNQTVRDVQSGMDLQDIRKEYQNAVRRDDPNGIVVWAGTAVGLMNEIKNAADVVRELHDVLVERIQATYSLLGVNST